MALIDSNALIGTITVCADKIADSPEFKDLLNDNRSIIIKFYLLIIINESMSKKSMYNKNKPTENIDIEYYVFESE